MRPIRGTPVAQLYTILFSYPTPLRTAAVAADVLTDDATPTPDATEQFRAEMELLVNFDRDSRIHTAVEQHSLHDMRSYSVFQVSAQLRRSRDML